MATTSGNAFTAKVSHPRIAGVLPRKRLFRLLDSQRKYPVVWLSAPAGSGKTTLVASYLDARKLPSLWYTVDAGDSDIAASFYYLGLAAKKAAPRYRKPLPLLTPEYLLGIPAFTQRYFEELFRRIAPPGPFPHPPKSDTMLPAAAGPKPFVLVFDNYQLAPPESPFHEFLNTGLALTPQGINTIIISRNEPPPAFIRLRANHQMALLGRQELRLTEDESRGFVRMKTDLKLTGETLSFLHQKTEGWVAGMVLMLETSRISGMDQRLLEGLTPSEIFDYFANEIFLKADPQVQDFLLKSAFLPSMTAQAAEALTGIQTAADILSGLEKNNYFIERRLKANPVYIYHRLFREFLMSRAKELFTPGEIAQIQRHAAALVMESGPLEDAAELMLAAGDWQRFVPFLLSHAKALFAQGRVKTLRTWLEAIPPQILEKVPWLVYWLGVCKMGIAPADGRNHLEKAFELFRAERDDAGAFLSWSAVTQTYLFEFNDFRPLDKWINWLDVRASRGIVYPSPEIAAHVACGMTGALAWRMPAHPMAKEWVRAAVGLSGADLDVDVRLRACTNSAIFHIWMGAYAECRILIERMRKLVQSQPASPARQILLRVTEAMFYNASAEFQNMGIQSISEGLEIARKSGVHLMDTLLYLQGVAGSLNAGDKAAASEYLSKMEKSIAPDRHAHSAHYYYFLSWYFVLCNETPRAAAAAKESLRLITQAGLPVSETLIRLALVLVLDQSGDREEACRQLATAGKICAQTGSAYCVYLCDLANAYLSFATGEQEEARLALRKALASGRRKGYVTALYFWRPDILSYLCMRALEEGIELEYTQDLIRTLGLGPPRPKFPPFAQEGAGRISTGVGECAILTDRWPWPVKVSTLGRFELQIDGKTAAASGKAQKKPLFLLKALIALGIKDVREEALANILWPEAEGDAAHNAMKTTIARLRQMIANDAAVQVNEGKISLDSRSCWVDIQAFEQLCTWAGQIFESRGDVPATPALRGTNEIILLRQIASRALGLYGGPFLHSETDPYWTVTTRERLRNRYLRLISQMARLSEQTGNGEEAADYYLKGIETEPMAEEFHQGLMASFIGLGRHAEALAVYKRCKAILQAELGIAPSARTDALRAEILRPRDSL